MSGAGSSPALATCETSQILLAGVPDVFSWGSPVFAHLLIGPSYMSLNNLERDVKLKKRNSCYFYEKMISCSIPVPSVNRAAFCSSMTLSPILSPLIQPCSEGNVVMLADTPPTYTCILLSVCSFGLRGFTVSSVKDTIKPCFRGKIFVLLKC